MGAAITLTHAAAEARAARSSLNIRAPGCATGGRRSNRRCRPGGVLGAAGGDGERNPGGGEVAKAPRTPPFGAQRPTDVAGRPSCGT